MPYNAFGGPGSYHPSLPPQNQNPAEQYYDSQIRYPPGALAPQGGQVQDPFNPAANRYQDQYDLYGVPTTANAGANGRRSQYGGGMDLLDAAGIGAVGPQGHGQGGQEYLDRGPSTRTAQTSSSGGSGGATGAGGMSYGQVSSSPVPGAGPGAGLARNVLQSAKANVNTGYGYVSPPESYAVHVMNSQNSGHSFIFKRSII